MSYEAMGKLIDRWVEDKEFRKQMRLDAEMAVRRSGIQLAPEEWEVLRKVDWKMPDEELQSRISKM
jgi:hypothetical protein